MNAATIPAGVLDELYRTVARYFGASEAETRAFAHARLTADLRGRDTQGAATLLMEIKWLRSGAARFGAPFHILKEGVAFAVADAGGGVGEVVATRAMDLAVERARTAGMFVVWLRNTNDLFAASSYALRAVEASCVGIVMSNSPPFVSAWGGREPLLGTNPIAIAIPAGNESPIVVDMSSSSLSHGKVVIAAREGRMLRDAVLVDEDGRITNDPQASVIDPLDRNSAQRGSILPAGPKGFGWMLFVELFTGLLSGMSLSQDVDMEISPRAPSRVGQCFIAVHVESVLPLEGFRAQVDRLIRSIQQSQPVEGVGAVVVPGEQAAKRAALRRVHGIPVSAEVLTQISEVAAEVGFDAAQLRAPAAP